VREGDFVKAGQVIARIDASEYQSRVQQASEQAASAKAQVEVVQRQYDNNKALVAQGFISKTALDASQANLDAARSTYNAAIAGADVARKSVADTVLRSPISGQVAQRLAQPGERVPLDGRIVEIVDLSRLELEAAISPQDLAALRVGAKARVTVEGSSDSVSATVARLNPSAQAGSRTVLAYLAVAAHPGLRNGLFASGAIDLEQRSALAIPLSAVRSDQAQPYAIRVAAQGSGQRAEQRPLSLGLRGQSGGVAMVEVLKGLDDGDRVLAASAGLVPDGVRLRLPTVAAQMPVPPASASAAASAAPAR
jgi:RND family efflux transporter MFP subunit